MQSAQNFPIAHPDCPAARSRRKRKGNAMPISDWQSPAAYEHAKDIAAAGMAWEYLRRDDEYRRAFQRMKTIAAPKPGGGKVFSERWGLRFPCRSGAACWPHACFLGNGTLA
ncbi:transcriptional regulator domain-containing protein [Acetobacter ghanensis]|uniref:transcriptional regulator domain-containing protein n=1 Tax=Acetobacter ghanensis TaxID=431306 RepID=UPI00357175B8